MTYEIVLSHNDEFPYHVVSRNADGTVTNLAGELTLDAAEVTLEKYLDPDA